MKYGLRLVYLAAALGLLPIGSPSAAQTEAKTEGACSPAIAGSNVRDVMIKCGERDAMQAKLSSAMTVMNNEVQSALDQPFEAGYLSLYDSSDPAFRSEGDGTNFYIFFAGDSEATDDFFPPRHKCGFQDGYAVSGVILTGHPGEKLHLTARALTSGDPVLTQICTGLGARAVWAGSEAGGSPLTNYDMIANESDFAVIALYPSDVYGQSFEERSTRAYWGGLISGANPIGIARSLIRSNRLSSVLDKFKSAGEVDFTIDAKITPFGPIPEVSDDALRAFGPAVQNMDRQWSEFLGRASVDYRGTTQALFTNGKMNSVVDRYKLKDLSGPVFWANISDGTKYTESVVCLATVFAVDNDYAGVGDLPSYRHCAATAKVSRAPSPNPLP
jgi:hypothetical protein